MRVKDFANMLLASSAQRCLAYYTDHSAMVVLEYNRMKYLINLFNVFYLF